MGTHGCLAMLRRGKHPSPRSRVCNCVKCKLSLELSKRTLCAIVGKGELACRAGFEAATKGVKRLYGKQTMGVAAPMFPGRYVKGQAAGALLTPERACYGGR